MMVTEKVADMKRIDKQEYEKQRREAERKGAVRLLSLVTQIGITTALCVAVGVFLGWLLDRLLGTSPFLLILFTILGVGAAFKNIYDISKGI